MGIPANGWNDDVEGATLANRELPVPYEAYYADGGSGFDFASTPAEIIHAEIVDEEETADVERGEDTSGGSMLRATVRREKAYGVSLIDSWGLQLGAVVHYGWRDADGSVITVYRPSPVSANSYAEACSVGTVPKNAKKMFRRAVRVGPVQGVACVRRQMTNAGPKCCVYSPPSSDQCPNFAHEDAGKERSASGSSLTEIYTYERIYLDAEGLSEGDDLAFGAKGKVSDPSVDLAASLDVNFYDSSGSLVEANGNAASVSEGSYQRMSGSLPVPAGAAGGYVEISSWRHGSATGEAFVKELQVNRGTSPCTYSEPGTSDCPNLLAASAADEYCGPDASGTAPLNTYPLVDLSRKGLVPGDFVSFSWQGTGTSADQKAALVVTFYDSGGSVLSSTEDERAVPNGSYDGFKFEAIEIPANATAVEVESEQRGSGSGHSCVRNVHMNRGRTACAFSEPDSPSPCENLMGTDAGPERTASGSGIVEAYAYEKFSIGATELEEGAPVAIGFAGRVSDATLDVEATIEIDFIDSSGTVLSTFAPVGLKGESYQRDAETTTIPTNTAEIQVRAFKKGADSAQAWVKEIQLNAGTDPCDYSEPGGSGISRNETITASDSPYTTQGEGKIFVDTSGGAVEIVLASADTIAGKTIEVADSGGTAATSNITVSTEGSETINGGSSVTISGNFASREFTWTGTEWISPA